MENLRKPFLNRICINNRFQLSQACLYPLFVLRSPSVGSSYYTLQSAAVWIYSFRAALMEKMKALLKPRATPQQQLREWPRPRLSDLRSLVSRLSPFSPCVEENCGQVFALVFPSNYLGVLPWCSPVIIWVPVGVSKMIGAMDGTGRNTCW
jgi:hypothetical protein